MVELCPCRMLPPACHTLWQHCSAPQHFPGLLIIFAGSWGLSCVHKLMVWLAVYSLLSGLHMVRTLSLAFVWRKSMDPA